MERSALLILALTGCVTFSVPPQALANNERCAALLNQGALDDAELACDHGLEFGPQDADLWVNKAMIAWRRGDAAHAKEWLIKALHYNPEQAQGYNDLGVIALAEHDYRSAISRFERALKVNPDYAEARNNLGLAYFQSGDLADAKRQYRTLVMTQPMLSEPHFDLGVIAYQEKDDAEAIRELRRAVELEPGYAAAWLHLGVVYDRGGQFKEAADAFNACLDADEKEDRCRTGLAEEREKLSTRSSGRRSPF